MQRPAETQYEIHEFLKQRYSPRAFTAQPVEDDKLLSLMEAARWAPSGGNKQPWAFIVVPQSDALNHPRLIGALSGANPTWAQNAPVLVVAVATLNPPPDTNRYAFYNLGLAVAQLTVQATALGLYVRQMGGFDHEKAHQALDIPDDHEPAVVLAIGYLGNVDDLPDELRQRELSARARKPLTEFVYGGRWGEPLQAELMR